MLPITYNNAKSNTAKSWRGLPTDSAAGNAVKDSTIAREFKGLNQIDSVCASSAKRDFVSKLSRLLTAFWSSRQKCSAAFGSAIAGWGVIRWGMGPHAVMPRPMMSNVFLIAGARSLVARMYESH